MLAVVPAVLSLPPLVLGHVSVPQKTQYLKCSQSITKNGLNW